MGTKDCFIIHIELECLREKKQISSQKNAMLEYMV